MYVGVGGVCMLQEVHCGSKLHCGSTPRIGNSRLGIEGGCGCNKAFHYF